ncbi:hypothetical protein V1460_18680 [Streptomyces sp. SCSIO 30461]|uniref:hypothetical protein n=1 Tax=Streptomyces sp. SCSIO 30461 TaxID=3118085 RepID=UPI0030D4E1F0
MSDRRDRTGTDDGPAPQSPGTHSGTTHDAVRLALVIGALGIAFDDIGTSPVYTLQTVFDPSDPHPVPVSTESA